MTTLSQGHVLAVSVSDGGVPKRAVDRTRVTAEGLVGDRQRHTAVHGGPERAVCLVAHEVIESLSAEGHPITPGSTGDNLTLAGIPASVLRTGVRLAFEGGVRLELTKPAAPCTTIRASFHDGDSGHLDAERDPARTRHYARVLTPGALWQGQKVAIEAREAEGT